MHLNQIGFTLGTHYYLQQVARYINVFLVSNSHEAQSQRDALALKYPMEHGLITDWNAMEKIWNHIFDNEMKIISQNHPMVLTETVFNPKAHREKMTQIMFETFGTPAFYVGMRSIFSLYAAGRTTGLIVNSGEEMTFTAPVYEGFLLPRATLELPLAGADVTLYIVRKLKERECSFTAVASPELIRATACCIKEELCYVACRFDEEMQAASQSSSLAKDYELPDKQRITLGSERFCASEVLFQPRVLGPNGLGIHEAVKHSISTCDPDIRRDLYSSILLTGGTTMLPGFADRLQIETSRLAPSHVQVIAPPHRQHSAWIGGSVLASLDVFQDIAISAKEYDEYGPGIVHRSKSLLRPQPVKALNTIIECL
ncbi:actin 5C [Coniophora puteana RWD-64-598 SS2]|uniref:Actin 5C n=1 Tax=Coniophora puteana (strain RWD-64-598) TaxID=741705 RepID=A0A5M3MTE5_CONPW|nr:actin 5C [Coniophora puteana RWD-64-598 SS2]EIW81935.1 actin 5C [Coniophora puteana RWD-64-598 SS2]